jgi:hypothetical protein
MISISEATERDKGRLIAFYEKNAGVESSTRMERRWLWQWHCDPRLESPGYRGVIAEWQGQVLGSVSCLPAGLFLRGRPSPAFWLADVRVDWALARRALKDGRGGRRNRDSTLSRGIAAAMFDHPAAGPAQLGKHIEEPMMAICRRIGFVTMPEAGNYMRRTSFSRPLQRVCGRLPGRWLAAIADPIVNRVPRPGVAVHRFDADFDSRFDRLWEHARQVCPAITLRDSALLNWHYRNHPDTAYQVLVVERDAGLRGYIVFKVFPRKGRLIARIVDLLTVKDDREAAESLIAAALAQCRREGAERTDCFATGADLIATLTRLGFVPRLTKKRKIQPLLARNLPDVALYVTSGDGDGG